MGILFEMLAMIPYTYAKNSNKHSLKLPPTQNKIKQNITKEKQQLNNTEQHASGPNKKNQTIKK